MKTFETKEAFLLDALDYYTTDTNRLCVNKGLCKYSPVNATKEGISEGCMIGRHMTPENQMMADAINPYGADVSLILKNYSDLLPDWLKLFESEFIRDCQKLHDNYDNWDYTGLTICGYNRLRDIINAYSLDKAQFEKYL